MKGFVFVTGMFRSGTTLLGTMLNAHPQIDFSLDPYLPIFKEVRNQVAARLFPEQEIDPTAPLDDYYFYGDKQALMRGIQAASLDLPVEASLLPELKEEVIAYSSGYSPKLAPFLVGLTGTTFAEIIASGVGIVRRAYGDAASELVGFKLAWTDEFAVHVLQRFPQAKVIHIVRDPRATCASKNVTQAKYPWLFLIRQWRKLVTFAWANCLGPKSWRDRALLVKFEDIVANPEREAKRICAFLDVDFSTRVIEPGSFVDGAGKPWVQNTSYASLAKRTFNTKSIDKWKDVLSKIEIEFIERLCFAEMQALGYVCAEADSFYIPPSLVFHPPVVPEYELVEWIREYAQVDTSSHLQNMALEHWRGSTISAGRHVDDEVKQALCLDTSFFDEVSRLVATA